jgi:hypothetical protein
MVVRCAIVIGFARAVADRRHGAFIADNGIADKAALTIGHSHAVAEAVAQTLTHAGVIPFDVARPAGKSVIDALIVRRTRRRVAHGI